MDDDEERKTVNALCRAHADACRSGDRELAAALRSSIARHISAPAGEAMPRKASKSLIKRVEASIRKYGEGCWRPPLVKVKRKKKAKAKPSGS
jgi:hypothetical protein